MAAKDPVRRRQAAKKAINTRHAAAAPRIAVDRLTAWTERAAEIPELDPSEVAQVGAIAARLDARLAGGSNAAA